MLRFRVRFPLGVYHAVSVTTPPEAEWPPSPLRLIGALLAAAHGRHGGSLELDREVIQRLCEAPSPLVQAPQVTRIGEASRPDGVYMLRGATRWVPRNYVNAKAGLSPRNLGRERSQVSKAGVAVGDTELAFVWPDLEFEDDAFDRLRSLAGDIAFLGTTRSPAIVAVDAGEASVEDDVWTPSDDASMAADAASVRVPDATTLAAFDRRERARASSSPGLEGTGMVPAIPTGRTVLYRPPGADRVDVVDPHWWGEMIILAVDPQRSDLIPRVAAAYLFARAVRVALLGAFDEPGSPGEAPPSLRARGADPHCAIVSLPSVTGPHPDGRIRGVAFVLPGPERAPRIHEERERIVAGLAHLAGPGPAREQRFVQIPGAGRVWLSEPDSRQASLWTLRTSLYTEPASTWRTVTPVVHSHWRKDNRGGLLGQVEVDCRHVGLPTPEAVAPLRGGRGMMPPSRVPAQWRSLLGGPGGHLEITFPEPVQGPVLLGRARHFGMGLCIPRDAYGSSGER
ncbi:MAG TPA: type I-U CRISPR-associated protein Csb2 [Polyangia bacterium]|nr:type I-U CRISPR-associated protein Csb2 [Polyangia bacterium]